MIRECLITLLVSHTVLLGMGSDVRSPAVANLSQGVFDFSVKLFNEVKEDGKNGIFSGYSLATVLSMTSLGAKGKTLKEIRRALGLSNSKKLVKQTYSQITRKMASDPNITLEIANGIFPQKDFQIRPSFIKIAKNHFKANVTSFDFKKADEAVQSINSWTEQKTHDKIKDLFPRRSINSDTVCVFVNAIYFKGDWKQKFDKEKTKDSEFYLLDGTKIQVPTMHETSMEIASSYIEPLKSEIFLFPYKGDRFTMIIILPDDVSGLSALEEQLSSKLDPKILDSVHYKSKRPVSLPKFKLESSYNLKESLKNIGINRLFSVKSDLSGIAGVRGQLYISTVVQKATIEVNEEGSEAAAATGMVVSLRSMPLPVSPVVINHPFIFFIRDQLTGMVIFSGRVLNPKNAS